MDKMYFIVFGLFSIIGLSIWCLVVYIISFTSGWHSLAKNYATDSFPEQTQSCSGVFNYSSNYTGTLEYAETAEGLYLKTSFLFKIGHRPLFIPWKAMQNYQQSSGVFSKYSTNFKVSGSDIKLNTDSLLMR